MSEYVYIRNWDKYQYRSDRRLPWIKLYVDLLDDDDYLRLSLADRGLLQDLWKLASLSGDGRVSADRVSLSRRLNVRRVSLERLIQGGFIEIRAHKRRRDGALEEKESREDKKEKPDLSRNRSSRAQGTVEEDQPKNGAIPKPELPAALARILDAKIASSLYPAQIEVVSRAWFCSTELRHSLASVEAADNPTAMLVSISQRIIKAGTP